MVEGRQRSEWQHTSHLLSLLANANRNPKKQRKPYKPKDFYPFAVEQHEEPKPQRVDIKDIMAMFPNAKPGGARRKQQCQ